MTSETDAEGNTTSYTYDALGRVTSVTYPAVKGVVTKTSTTPTTTRPTSSRRPTRGGTSPRTTTTGWEGSSQEQTYLSPSSPYSSEFYTYNWLNEVLTDTSPNGAITYVQVRQPGAADRGDEPRRDA